MRHTIRKLFLTFILGSTATLCACGARQEVVTVPDNPEAIENWHYARNYQAQGRFELSRQYYLLALSSARTQDVHDALAQELQAVTLQIRSLR